MLPGHRRARGVPPAAGARAGPGHHAHRPGRGERPHRRPRPGRRRLRGQAVLAPRSSSPGCGRCCAGRAGPLAPSGPDAASVYADGDLDVDVAAREARLAGAVVALTAREFELLVFLMRHPAAGVPPGGAPRGRVGLPLRRHVDGHRPRPPPAGEDRARPVGPRADRHRVGRRATGGRAWTRRCAHEGAGPRRGRPGGRRRPAARRAAWRPVLRRPACSRRAWRPALFGLPASDAAVLVAISFGVALATYAVGRAAVVRSRSPVVVGLIPVVSVALGSLAAARAMFVSSHDLAALVVVVVGAGTAGVLGGAGPGRRARDARGPGRPPWPSASGPSSAAAASWWRGSATTCARRSPASGPWSRRSTTGWSSTTTTVRRYHHQLTVEADRLARLVDDLFELSRIEADALQLTVEQVPLGELVSDAVASAARGGRGQGGRARRPGRGRRGGAGPSVAGSTPELSRVVRNLLDNAIRHTPAGRRGRGGGARRRRLGRGVRARRVRRHPRRRPRPGVRPGLPGRRRPHARCRRRRRARAWRIARGLVEAHHGDIAVRNENGGCRFTVRLPRA